jgi:hypothetical protein
MGDIYSSAQEVLIWLGDGGEPESLHDQPRIYRWTGDDTDMEIVDAYFDQTRPQSDDENDSEEILGAFFYLKLRAMGDHLDEIPFFEADDKKLQPRQTWPAVIRALDTLISNPWWTRIWVVQETVLAREATVVYSHVTAPWEMLAQAAHTSETKYSSCCVNFLQTLSPVDENVLVKVRRVVLADVEPVRTTRAKNKQLSLRRFMIRTPLREATNVRDKVYGLLGLVTNCQGKPPLLADYSMPPKEVFMQAIISHIEGTISLQGLMGTTRTDVFDTPSWVTQKSHTQAWSIAQGSRINRSNLFSAANGVATNFERVGDILTVEGFKPSDTIASVGPTMGDVTTEIFSHSAIAHNIEAWRNIFKLETNKNDIYFGKHPWAEAFWRTVLSDWTNDPSWQRFGDTNPTHLAEDFRSWLATRIRGKENGKPSAHPDSEQKRLFIRHLVHITILRRFFITTDGRMGMGPPEALPGDFIAILLGGNVPFCLRADSDEHSGYYRLVGDTYVHGLTDGEGVPADWEEHSVKIHL